MKKDKTSTNTRDEKNSDTGITLKKIDSTISVSDNKDIPEKVDIAQEITSKVSSSIEVTDDESKENISKYIPLKTRTIKKKIVVYDYGKHNQDNKKIELNDVKLPKIKLVNDDEENSKSLNPDGSIKKKEDPTVQIKRMVVDVEDKPHVLPPKNISSEPPKIEDVKPIISVTDISKEIFDNLDNQVPVSAPFVDTPDLQPAEPKIEDNKPIIPVTEISKEIFDNLDNQVPVSAPSLDINDLDKTETKLLQEEPELIPTQEPMIVPQEFPEVVPQELPMIIPQELPEVIPQELPAIIPQELLTEVYDFKPDGIHELPVSIPLDKLPETLEKQFLEKQQKELQERIQKEIEDTLKERYNKLDLKNVTVVIEDKIVNDKINETIPKKPEIKIIIVEDINKLLLELDERTKTLISDDTMLELYSFRGELPKVSKISYKTYNIQNLYSKIDDLSKIAKQNSANAQIKVSDISDTQIPLSSKQKFKQELNEDAIIEELMIPEIIPIKDNITDIDSLVNNKFSESIELRDESMQIPTFVDSKSGPELNKKVQDNLKTINENKLKKEQSKQNTQKHKSINSIVDSKKVTPTTQNQEHKQKEIDPRISLLEKELKEEKERFDSFIRQERDKPVKTTTNEIDPKTYLLEKELKEEKERFNNYLNQEMNKPIEAKEINPRAQVPTNEPTGINAPRKEQKPENEIYINKDQVPKSQEKGVSYILPKDAKINFSKNAGYVGLEGVQSTPHTFNFEKNKMQSLVYSTPMNILDSDITKVFEKYSLDDFTYVTISYIKGKGLFYNMIQLELTPEQNKVFYEIKKIFFNSIDQNYYTFNGDKYTLDQYTQKIFDISLSKLSYQVNSLDKKLFYKFIQREFSGLGILTALLSDKKVLEVSCAGEKTSVVVYHMEYGTLETNINFDNINKLNQFVLLLTKNMGLYVNSSHPIIEGYLPNGYKVEGLFSAGELSSKGSSFVIKKYLDAPITPTSLIKAGVGTIDVFAYIWSAINEDYKIILTGDDTSFIFLNSVGLLYPDKKIISVQSYDRIKLPQKQWIKRVVTGNEEVDKKTIIQHTVSERPDYIFVDEFGSDVFDVPWYAINLFYVTYNQVPQLRENIRTMGQKAIIIELQKLKIGYSENTQIIKIEEIVDRNDFITIELSTKDKAYHMNLLSSTIDIVNFNKRRKYMRWLSDTNMVDYRDFNNIVNEFYVNEEKVIKRLGIDITA